MAENADGLELTFDVTFSPSFRGLLKHVFTDAFDADNASSGYRDVALWDVK